jgi:large subunit ribosomal protein L23
MSMRPYNAKQVKLSRDAMYDIVRRPVITEKATRQSEHNVVVFEVPLSASKPEIKVAIETLFSVKVKAVNTSIARGKAKLFRGRPGVRSNWKKALVTLVEGHSIDVTTGL